MPRLAAVLALVPCLVVPASASAADVTVVSDPVTVKGFRLTLTATVDRGDSTGVVTVRLARRDGAVTQVLQILAEPRGARGQRSDVSELDGSLRAFLTRDGRAELSYRATSPRSRVRACPWAPSAGTARGTRGVLRGTLRIPAARLGTITVRSLRARVLVGSRVECPPLLAPRTADVRTATRLGGVSGRFPAFLEARRAPEGPTDLEFQTGDRGSPPRRGISILEQGASLFEPAGDLSTATLGGGRAFVGSLRFAGTGSACESQGAVTGTLTVRSRLLADQVLRPAGSEAILQRGATRGCPSSG